MDHFIGTKIPKLGIFVDKNSQNDQTPFPKVGRKNPEGQGCQDHFIDHLCKTVSTLYLNGSAVKYFTTEPNPLASLFYYMNLFITGSMYPLITLLY